MRTRRLYRALFAIVPAAALTVSPRPAAAEPSPELAAAVPHPSSTRAPREPGGNDPARTPAPEAGEPAEPRLPGDESGRIDEPAGDDSLVRHGLRAALFVPKVVASAALSPVRLGMWAYDRYHLDALYERVFYNDARTIGLVPTASFESGFGISAGARFVDRDLLGGGESLSIMAVAGGRYQQVYRATLHSGRRLGDRLAIELAGQYERRPKDPFYGIGDAQDSARPAMPVDPAVDPTSVETRYRERIARIAGVIDVTLIDPLHLRGAGELTDRTFAASATATPITAVYDPAALVGYGGVRYVYAELELRLDSRGRVSTYEPRPRYAAGSLAALFAGRVHRIDGAPDYERYGLDLQHFLRLGDGPRVLALRLRGEAVSGGRSVVPFTELPQLGGADDLRGYPADRFRDTRRLVGSIEYAWDLSAQLAASLFVDAGRVFASADELVRTRPRVGYGVALQAHTENAFGVTASLASSIDGGLLLTLSFDSVFALDERVRRR